MHTDIIRQWLIFDRYSDKSYQIEIDQINVHLITTAYPEDRDLPHIPLPMIIKEGATTYAVADLRHPNTSADIQPYDDIRQHVLSRGIGDSILRALKLQTLALDSALDRYYKELIKVYTVIITSMLKNNINIDEYDMQVLDVVIKSVYIKHLFKYETSSHLEMLKSMSYNYEDMTQTSLESLAAITGSPLDAIADGLRVFETSSHLRHVRSAHIVEALDSGMFGSIKNMYTAMWDDPAIALSIIHAVHSNVFLKKTKLFTVLDSRRLVVDSRVLAQEIGKISNY